jgi:hypothetical protein
MGHQSHRPFNAYLGKRHDCGMQSVCAAMLDSGESEQRPAQTSFEPALKQRRDKFSAIAIGLGARSDR